MNKEQIYPDHEKVRGTNMADVNRSLVEEYCTKNFGKPVDDMGVSYERLLENLHILASNGECTLAGLLFFGLAPQQYMPSMMIKAVAFYGNDMGERQCPAEDTEVRRRTEEGNCF